MKYKIISCLICFVGFLSCKKSAPEPTDSLAAEKNATWTSASHSNEASPDYAMVFPQDKVNRLDIILGKTTWEAIKTDMSTLGKGTFGAGGAAGQPGAGGPVGGGPVGGGGAVPSFGPEPNYVEATIKMNDKEWQHVGFRLKGNSTLSNTWRSGIYKLPFRLKMDEWEDKYPETKNQRFYGFKDLTFSAGVKDNSLIREKVTADIFRLAGIPAARTAFYRLYIDFGEGPKYCGVYTMVEAVDDTMLKDQLGEDKGNLYKPESNFTSFNTNAFPKKNNEEAADYNDVKDFVTALNHSSRSTDAPAWRAALEKTANMQQIIKWLAINTTLTNWDTYGSMAHNHYLYHHSSQKLIWIPWDNNEALSSNNRNISLSLSNVGNQWPLINYIAADPVYYAAYKSYVRAFATDHFSPEKINPLLEQASNLISPYVTGTEKEVAPYSNLTNSTAFSGALVQIKTHVQNQHKLAVALQ